jgi:hypothetical protein
LPRDSSGNYTLPPENPVVAGELITDLWANTTMDDIAQALTQSLDRSGQGGMLAPFYFTDGSVMQPGAAWSLEKGSGFSRTDVGTVNVSILGALNMTWDQNGVTIPAGKRISIIDAPVDPTDAVNLESLGALPPNAEVGDGKGNLFAIGYRDIPRTDTGWERGKCWVINAGVTLTTIDMGEGYTYTLLNASANPVAVASEPGIDLKVTGSDVSAVFTLEPWTMVTIWCESTTVARVAAVLPLTGGDVNAALGYVPYDSSNPAGFLNAITAAQVIDALGYNPVAPAGTFATGTWNISINGNAATASALTGLARAVSAALAIPAGSTAISSLFSAASSTGTVPSRVPDSFAALWRCTAANNGYAAGDEVLVMDGFENGSSSAAVSASSTQWQLAWQGDPPEIASLSNPGVRFTLQAASWALVFRGVWLP